MPHDPNPVGASLFGAALIAYFFGSVIFLANLFLKHTRLGRVALGISLVGALFHTASIILRAVETGSPPFSTASEGWSFLGWAVVVIYLSISLRPRLHALGAFALPAALISVLVAAAWSPALHAPILPGVSTWALILHVPASILSLGAFVVAFGCAVCYLIQDRLLKEKRLTGLLRSLPPLDVLDTTSYWLVVFGFCLLTVGMVSGGILAQDAWKSSWLRHSKTYVSLLLWITYGAYLYFRGVAQWRGRWTHTMIVVSVVVLLALYGGTFAFSRASYAAPPDAGAGYRTAPVVQYER